MLLITELQIISGKKSNAPKGFEKIPVDLNKGAGGEYLYLCYKKEEATSGVIDILVLHDKKADGRGVECPSGYEKIGMDLNKKAKGEFIFLAYKKGTPEQSCKFGITDLSVLDNGVINSNTIHTYKDYMIKAIDLNKGAGGDYLYLAYKNVSKTSLCNWMNLLQNDMSIVDVSIPGTHDTMTYKLKETTVYDLLAKKCSGAGAAAITAALVAAGIASAPLLLVEFKKSGAEKLGKTQNYDLLAQLECGTRFVDIRATSMLGCHHGMMTCTNNFEHAMNDIESFLKDNPSEFVVVRLGDQKPDESKKQFLNDLLAKKSDVIWKGKVSDFSSITVGSLRGKMIFLYGNEFSEYVSNMGAEYSKSASYLEIQDNYKQPNVSEKYSEIKNTIKNRNKNKLTINHVSAAMKDDLSGIVNAFIKNKTTPIGYAETLNPQVGRYLLYENQNQADIGIVIFDFIDPDLAWAVIKHNFGV